MLPGTKVVHAEKPDLTGVVREYREHHDFGAGPEQPAVRVSWGPGGTGGESWIALEGVVALEMEDAVADRAWFSCYVNDGEAVVRMGDIEFYGEVMQSEVHTTAYPDRTAQVVIVIRDPLTRGVENPDEAHTYETFAE